MKRLSFKTKTTLLITLLITAVCAISVLGFVFTSRYVQASELKQSLINVVERNSDEVEYENGILDIENDFKTYSNGVYCNVYNLNSELLLGDLPAELFIDEEYTENKVRSFNIDGKKYWVFDSLLNFRKYEYEIDVLTGNVISYEADSTNEEFADGNYPTTFLKNGIDSEKAINIALKHAGFSRSEATIISVKLPSYADRQVFHIEFAVITPVLESVWLRGIVPASDDIGSLGAVGKTVLYILPLFIPFAALGAYYLAKHTISPVAKIAASAEEISSGNDLTKRIALGKGKDEIHALANSFNEMFSRLERSFENEKQFTSDASHELRTPLSVIKAECDYALSEYANDEDILQALQSINEQTDKMTELVALLLMLSRTEQSGRNHKLEHTNISERVLETCSSFHTEKGITLAHEIEPDVFINAEPHLITRLCENLLSNAEKYGKENGHILVKLFTENNDVILSVADDGVGIKEEDLDKIFSRFYRADSSRSGYGFGIGLSLVQKIVALHGGKIYVHSMLGEGTIFSVKFSKNVNL